MSEISRISWSKHRASCPKRKPVHLGGAKDCNCQTAITVYDWEGGFITRLEHQHDVIVFNEFIRTALRTISAEQQRRKEFKHADRGNEEVRIHQERGEGGEEVREADGQEADQKEVIRAVQE